MRPSVTTAAILFTDMVGSTELRGRLGDERADRLRKHHDEIVLGAVHDHHGDVLRSTGDGVKAAFTTASDAVSAAVDVQRAIAAYAASADAVAAFEVRIGVSIGEVVVDDGDHHGMTVIEAARLEAAARPGEILVTDMVRLLARRLDDVGFDEVGERRLKGIDTPVVVHRVVDLTAAPIPAPARLAADQVAPMVGRADQLAAFDRLWAAARTGSSGVLVVRSRAGHGASRLLAECTGRAHDDRGIVLAGSCRELGPPYEPFVEALREVASLDDELERALRDPSQPLARLFPGSTADTADTHPNAARLDLFDAVVALVRRLTRRHPVLLAFDDLHRADASTVRLLEHLVGALAGERLLVVVAAHDDPHDDEAAFVVPTWPRTPPSEVACAPLTEEQLIELVRLRAPGTSPLDAARLGHDLLAASAGSPAFAAALVEHVAAGGMLMVDEAAAGVTSSMPASVREVVERRLRRLDADDRELLATAAIAGSAFDVDVVATALERSAGEVLDVLDRLDRDEVVTEVAVGRFAFTHTIVRTHLLDELGPTRRAWAHRRVAEAHELRRPDQFDELIFHWRLAGDESRTIEHLERAARRDMVALAFESARDRSQQVVDLLARDAHADSRRRAIAWLCHGSACRALGESTYTEAILRAARLARAARDTAIFAEAAALSTWPGTFFFIAERPDHELIELCEDALELLDRADPLRVRVLASLASHLTFGSDRERRAELIGEALELAALHHDPLLTANVLNAEFVCLWEPATLERREQIARDLGRIARATGDAEVEFLAGFFAAYCVAERCRLDEAHARLIDLAPVASASRNRYFEFLAERLVLSIDIARCEPGTAARVDELMLRHADTYADTEGTWALQAGLLAHQVGALGGMTHALEALTTGQKARTWIAALALARVSAGDLDGARDLLVAQGDVPKNYFWITVAQVQAEVAATVGSLDHCRHLYDELLPSRGRMGITASGSLCLALVSRSLGELALALGRHDEAIDHLSEAMAQADECALPFEGVVARRLLAASLRALGRHHEAGTCAAAAIDTARARGFARELALLEAATGRADVAS
ncbi:MAG: AAA family ATPase [Acidimicrobiales bacterium]